MGWTVESIWFVRWWRIGLTIAYSPNLVCEMVKDSANNCILIQFILLVLALINGISYHPLITIILCFVVQSNWAQIIYLQVCLVIVWAQTRACGNWVLTKFEQLEHINKSSPSIHVSGLKVDLFILYIYYCKFIVSLILENLKQKYLNLIKLIELN